MLQVTNIYPGICVDLLGATFSSGNSDFNNFFVTTGACSAALSPSSLNEDLHNNHQGGGAESIKSTGLSSISEPMPAARGVPKEFPIQVLLLSFSV